MCANSSATSETTEAADPTEAPSPSTTKSHLLSGALSSTSKSVSATGLHRPKRMEGRPITAWNACEQAR